MLEQDSSYECLSSIDNGSTFLLSCYVVVHLELCCNKNVGTEMLNFAQSIRHEADSSRYITVGNFNKSGAYVLDGCIRNG